MFEQASRLKLRFGSTQGGLTVEDLWDLPLTSTRNRANLNDVAKEISRELKSADEEDFVNPKAGGDETLRLKLDIVKHVIQVRQAENEAERTAADRKEKKSRILAILAQKQEQELYGKTSEELQAMVADL